MTDHLVRIPFADDSDFSAQALAPGLPMLDGRKLAYQVLLGWFGDMLAEPELDDDGVRFYVQSRGQRQKIAEHALATQQDLDGHLAGDFERLKKALFDVRPVSPSERLIFNRLQPPIGNFDGRLYRVRPSGSSDRLVWCWGFQRRRTDGDVLLCPHRNCSLLFVRTDTESDCCPACGEPLFARPTVARKTSFPTGAVAATVVLSGLVGATYWVASVSGDESIDALPALAAVSPPILDEPESAGGITDNASATAAPDPADSLPDTAPDTQLAAAPDDGMPDDGASHQGASGDGADDATAIADRTTNGTPRPDPEQPPQYPFGASVEPRRLDLLPQAAANAPPSAGQPRRTGRTTANRPPQKPLAESTTAAPGSGNPARESGNRASDAASDIKTSRPTPRPPEKTAPQESPSAPAATRDLAGGSTGNTADPAGPPATEPTSPPQPSQLGQTATDRSPNAPEADRLSGSNQKPDRSGNRPLPSPDPMWTTDYVDAYQRAIAGRRLLIMLFRPPSDTGTTGGNSDNLPGPADLPVLSETVCVLVPTDMRIPGQPPESTARLLDHRSFRHLQGEPGIAVVDLTSTDSPHFGRVVSAFPGATDRRSILAALQPALTLPPGTISQRSLLMAIRAAEPESPLARQGSLEFLNGLANRNCRYMAHLEQSGLFEAEQRREAVYQQFGDDAVLLEHVFATDSPTTLQSAAAAAAAFWKADGKLTLAEGRQVLGYGLDLFESTGSGRWYATLLIVTTPDQ